MKNYYYLIAAMLCFATGISQNTVEVDANAEFLGYANVFELPANGGGYIFGEPWGVSDLQTIVDPGAGTITLQPNFNAWGDGTDPFWVDQNTGEGNKIFEGNTYVEDNTLVGSELTFIGGTVSNTIDAGYNVIAFIKVFNADFSVVKQESAELVAGENFEITYTNVEGTDTYLQYGFQVTGVNANPENEVALGSVVVSATLVVGTTDNVLNNFSAYPNPSNDQWMITSALQNINTIELFDAIGKKVAVYQADAVSFSIHNESLSRGLYFAKIYGETGTTTLKLIKN
jgi:hypothetical protein